MKFDRRVDIVDLQKDQKMACAGIQRFEALKTLWLPCIDLSKTCRVEGGVGRRKGIMSPSQCYSYTLGVLTRLGEAPHPSLRGKNISQIKSLGWNVLENTECRAVRPNGVAPGLADDAQSRRHNTSDFITI